MKSQEELDIESIEALLASKTKALKEKQEAISSLTPIQRLAVALHEALCTSNHLDQCSWNWDGSLTSPVTWNCWTHKEYIKKAESLLEIAGSFTVSYNYIDIYKTVKKI